MARAVKTFVDPTDVTHIYRQGDAYPREGVKPDRERMAELKKAGLIEGREIATAAEPPRNDEGPEIETRRNRRTARQ